MANDYGSEAELRERLEQIHNRLDELQQQKMAVVVSADSAENLRINREIVSLESESHQIDDALAKLAAVAAGTSTVVVPEIHIPPLGPAVPADTATMTSPRLPKTTLSRVSVRNNPPRHQVKPPGATSAPDATSTVVVPELHIPPLGPDAPDAFDPLTPSTGSADTSTLDLDTSLEDFQGPQTGSADTSTLDLDTSFDYGSEAFLSARLEQIHRRLMELQERKKSPFREIPADSAENLEINREIEGLLNESHQINDALAKLAAQRLELRRW